MMAQQHALPVSSVQAQARALLALAAECPTAPVTDALAQRRLGLNRPQFSNAVKWLEHRVWAHWNHDMRRGMSLTPLGRRQADKPLEIAV